MGREDWYRKQTWTQADQSAFFERLAKSRGAFHKAQYARIQAWELHHNGGSKYASAALELLDKILDCWKEEAQLAMVHHQRAECLLDLGDEEGAIAAFRATLDEQRRVPGIMTNAHLDFAWWVAVSGRQDLFIEALGVLNEFSEGLQFPATIYLSEGARALIRAASGDNFAAGRHARNALDASAAIHSVLRYHPTVGLVHVRIDDAHERLARLAASD
jgi:tetratricopeptide (TPR) repeat protein